MQTTVIKKCDTTVFNLPPRKATVNAIVDYLNANYNRRLCSETISADLSYSFDYLNRLLNREAGTTVFRALEAIRMENAKKQLRS